MDGPAATGGSSPTTITPPCVSLRFAVLCCAALRCSAIRRGCSEARRRHCPESPDNLPYVAPKTAPAPAAPDAARAPARRHTRRQPSRRATPPARLPFHCTSIQLGSPGFQMPGPPTRGRHLPRLSVTCKVQVHRGSATPAPAPAARGPCEQPTVPRPRLLVGGQRQSIQNTTAHPRRPSRLPNRANMGLARRYSRYRVA